MMGRLLMTTYPNTEHTTSSSLLERTTSASIEDDIANEHSNDTEQVFYWINRYPVTYGFFGLNVILILVHIGIIALNSCMITAIRRSRKAEEPGAHCLISKSLCTVQSLMFCISVFVLISSLKSQVLSLNLGSILNFL